MVVDEDTTKVDFGVSMGYKKVVAIYEAYTVQEKETE